MKLYTEKDLRDFEFWSGAKDRAKYLTEDELNTIENELEAIYPDGLSETELNDLFWFEFDFICNLIGTTEVEVFEREAAE